MRWGWVDGDWMGLGMEMGMGVGMEMGVCMGIG